jgi:hypothetical protein
VTATVGQASYFRAGRLIVATCAMNVTGSGTGANVVTVSLPVTASTSSVNTCLGSGFIFDASAPLKWKGLPVLASTTTLKMMTVHSATDNFLGATDFTAALAVNDVVSVLIAYEAATG